MPCSSFISPPPPSPLRGRYFALLAGLMLCLVLAGCKPSPGFHGTDLSGADFAAEFPQPLQDHQGQLRRLVDFRGRVVIVFFGYTHCPDVCPTALSRFAAVLAALGQEAERVQVLFVTVDPARDTPARLAAYVPWFHPTFLGLGGDQEAAVAAALKEFRIYAVRQEQSGALGYSLDHSTGAYVYDPQGRLRLLLQDNAAVADVVSDLRRLLHGG